VVRVQAAGRFSAMAEAAPWVPDEGSLATILGMLHNSTLNDNEAQREAYQALEAWQAIPQLMQFLVYALVQRPDLPPKIRAVAGSTLKSQIARCFDVAPPEVQAYVKAEVVRILADPVPAVQRCAANVVATIIRYIPISEWPALPPALVAYLDALMPTDQVGPLAGVMKCVAALAEDAAVDVDEEDGDDHGMREIMPRLIVAMQHGDPRVRLPAAQAMRWLVKGANSSLTVNTEDYLAVGGLGGSGGGGGGGGGRRACPLAIAVFGLPPVRPTACSATYSPCGQQLVRLHHD
jgi:hypothetical protein